MTDMIEQKQAAELAEEAEQGRSLYGSLGGDWMVVVTPHGSVPPPTIVVGRSFHGTSTLMYLGTPVDAVTQVYNHFRSTESQPQAKLAEVLGVSQQSVSRYVAGKSEPSLSNGGWSCLVEWVFRCRWGV